MWRPSANIATLKLRAKVIKSLRTYLDAEGLMEVETPLMSQMHNLDENIASITALYCPDNSQATESKVLKTSPESGLKRLLAAGSGSIYQLGKVFRNGERGRLHNPEFTLLEWYRLGYQLSEMMEDLLSLINTVLDLPKLTKISYQALFLQYLQIDPWLIDKASLLKLLPNHGIYLSSGECQNLTIDDCLDLLLSQVIQPQFNAYEGLIIYNYPKSQAALAMTKIVDGREVALRFELYIGQLEIANAYEELLDVSEQSKRLQQGKIQDDFLLAALKHGLPPCSGVAMGVDRLMMLIAKQDNIAKVISFGHERA